MNNENENENPISLWFNNLFSKIPGITRILLFIYIPVAIVYIFILFN